MGALSSLFKRTVVGDWDTGGPAEAGTFGLGWYNKATSVGAHPSRVGGPIDPGAVVVHTTDMRPNDFDALVRAWTTRPGPACAHFIIGRTSKQGLVQLTSILRNGNHAGGPVRNGAAQHGWWGDSKTGRRIHPNHLSVGIEVHAAGLLKWLDPAKTVAGYVEGGKIREKFSGDEIYVDSLVRPWHAVTPYQLATLEELLSDLQPALNPRGGLEPRPLQPFLKNRSAWDTSYAVPGSNTLVGHASLSPGRKMDPGPQIMAFINHIAEKNKWH